MFPRHELVFGPRTNAIAFQQDYIISVDDLSVDPPISNNIIDFGSTQNIETQFSDPNIQREKEMRRIRHRDIERTRREEMSKLHASLRSLLPLDHNKGFAAKQLSTNGISNDDIARFISVGEPDFLLETTIVEKMSMSDHMQEALNYTKQLQKKVQELRTRREILLKDLPTSSGTKNTTSSGCHNSPNCVTLNMVKDGIEILIRSSINSSDFRLSLVIEELHAKELNVVSCVSTKINGKFLHKIQAEFNDDLRLNDVSMLQERLTELIN